MEVSGVTLALLVILLTVFILFYRHRRWRTTLFKRLGLPGPEPNWFFGNISTMRQKHKQLREVISEWTKKYGKIYGYYEGPRPHVVISDVDLVQEVLVKNFSKFPARKLFAHMSPNERSIGSIVSASGLRWKRLRAVANPTFSSAKLKQMMPAVGAKVDILEQTLREESSQDQQHKIEIMDHYQRLTLAVIGDVAFGLGVDPQQNPEEPFLFHVKELFRVFNQKQRPLPIRIFAAMPELRHVLGHVIPYMLKLTPIKRSEAWLLGSMGKVVMGRRQGGERRRDLLQMMLDAEVADVDDIKDWEMTLKDTGNNQRQTPIIGAKKLTDNDIRAQSFVFLIAGYETTATTVTYATYLLATNPDKQKKLQQEVDQYLPKGVEVSYDILQQMTYLHQVLYETLRMFPVAGAAVNREANEDSHLGGFEIPKGTIMHIDVWSIHYNRDIWGPDTEVFRPERFDPEEHADRHPMAWLPFGAGPKNCIGMRFGLMEIEMALCHLLRKYTFEKCQETQIPLQLSDNIAVVPRDGVTVRLARRQDLN